MEELRLILFDAWYSGRVNLNYTQEEAEHYFNLWMEENKDKANAVLNNHAKVVIGQYEDYLNSPEGQANWSNEAAENRQAHIENENNDFKDHPLK